MDIILLERVAKLGQMGDTVSVKDGYARNFLLPSKKAMRATESNKKFFEAQRKEIEARNLELKAEAEKISKTIADIKVILIRQAGESGQLYGSVTTRDIANGVSDAGVAINRAQVTLSTPIKTLGLVSVAIKLHPEVIQNIVVNVARSQEEAETQFETGAAVVGSQDENEYVFEPGGFDEEDEEDEVAIESESEETVSEE